MEIYLWHINVRYALDIGRLAFLADWMLSAHSRHSAAQKGHAMPLPGTPKTTGYLYPPQIGCNVHPNKSVCHDNRKESRLLYFIVEDREAMAVTRHLGYAINAHLFGGGGGLNEILFLSDWRRRGLLAASSYYHTNLFVVQSYISICKVT